MMLPQVMNGDDRQTRKVGLTMLSSPMQTFALSEKNLGSVPRYNENVVHIFQQLF
jgi:hypothetical protein